MSLPLLGEAAQWVALAACVAALCLQGVALRGRARLFGAARGATVAAVAASTVALFTLVAAFILARVDIEYVFLYTRTDYSFAYRLVGVWGAQKGTILLWTAMTAWMAGWLWWRTRPAAPEADRKLSQTLQLTQFFLLLILLAFLYLVVRQDTFAPTPAALLESRPMGNGLNPVLMDPYILIHPPAEFLGYAMVAVPAAGALAHLAAGRPDWSAAVRAESRVGWIMYTIALALGALWAYTTLNFGGYWAWDPVEVANLIPWLLLTAFLHARAHHERYGSYSVLAPVLAMAAFLLTLFQTIATRSGLWISVHAFTDPTGTFARDPYLRFVNILTVEPAVAAITGIAVAFGLLSLGLASRRAAQGPMARGLRAYAVACLGLAGAFVVAPATAMAVVLEVASLAGSVTLGLLLLALASVAFPVAVRLRHRQADGAAQSPLSPRGMIAVALVVLGSGSLVILILLLRGVNGSNRAVFEDWAPILALPVVLMMIPAFGHGVLGRSSQLRVMAVGGAASLLAALVWQPWQVGLLAPAVAAASALGFWRLSLMVAPRRSPPPARLAATCLLGAGIVGILYWSSPPAWLLGTWPMPSGPVVQAAGLSASILIIVLAPLAGQGRNFHATAVGAVLSVATIGYGAGLLAGVAVAATLAQRRGAFTVRPVGAGIRAKRSSYPALGVHLLHLGLIVLIAGYSVSTHGATQAPESLMVAPGHATTLGQWRLDFAGAETVTDDEGVSEIQVALDVTRAGRPAGQAIVGFHWVEQVRHYDPETNVLRLGGHDLNVASLAFCRDPAGRCAGDSWVTAHEDGVGRLAPDEPITAVVLEATVLPLVGLVWGGVNLILVGATFIVAGRQGAPAPAPVRESLEMRLERELAALTPPTAPAPSHSAGPGSRALDEPTF